MQRRTAFRGCAARRCRVAWSGPGSGPCRSPARTGTRARDLYLDPEGFHEAFASDVDSAMTAVTAATQRPFAETAFAGPSGPPAWKTGIPCWYLLGTEDDAIPPALQRLWPSARTRPSWRCRPPTSRTTGESPELGPPGRGLVKSHEELRLAVGERLGAGPLGEQLTPAGTGSAATENRSGRLVQRYVPPHGPGHQNALQGRGIVPPGNSDQPPDPGPDSSPSVLVRQRHLVSIVMGPAGRPALPSRPRQPRAAPIRARALHSSGIPTLFTVRRIAFYGTAVRLTRSVTMPTIAATDGPTKI